MASLIRIRGEDGQFIDLPAFVGPYYTPSISSDGILSWTNNSDLPNPPNVNIKGPQGDPYTHSEEFSNLAAQVADDARNADASAQNAKEYEESAYRYFLSSADNATASYNSAQRSEAESLAAKGYKEGADAAANQAFISKADAEGYANRAAASEANSLANANASKNNADDANRYRESAGVFLDETKAARDQAEGFKNASAESAAESEAQKNAAKAEADRAGAAAAEAVSGEVDRAMAAEAAISDSKQNKLIAGENITIAGDVISATGGMTPEEREQLEYVTDAVENGVSNETSYPYTGKSPIPGLETLNRFVGGDGKWTNRPAGEKNCYVIVADGLTAVRITSHATRGNYVTPLKTLATDFVDFCDGYDGRITVEAGQTQEISVPPDCGYILIQRKPSSSTISEMQEIVTIAKSGSLLNHEQRITALEEKAADKPRSVIIGASIEAGTTHETSTSSAVINASKAYLTVALQRNGHEVTNLSEGGMGFVRQSQHSSNYFRTIVDNTDFSNYDCCWISLGTNDWNYNLTLGSVDDSSGANTVCGQLKYGIEKIMQSNPWCKIYVKMPEIRGSKGDISTIWGWNAKNTATVPYTQAEMEASLEAVCSAYNIQTYGKRGSSIVNALNLETVLPDKTHPSVKTMALMADAMTGAIPYKRR